MSDTCSLFPQFGDPWPSCLLPSQHWRWTLPSLNMVPTLSWFWSSLGPKWAWRSGPIEGESSIVWTTVRSYLRPYQGPVINSVNTQWGPESGHIEGQSEAQCGPDTGSSEEPTQGPVRSRVLCSEAKHPAPWHSSSLDADSGPQGAPSLFLTGQWFWSTCWLWTSLGFDSVLTLAWFSSSLVLDSHPYFGWQFPSSGLLSADRMLVNLCSFTEWMTINRLFSRQLLFSNCLDSKMWGHHVSTEALISRVTARMFPCTFWALWTHSWVTLGLPMRKQAAGVRLTELSAKLFLPSLVDSPLEMLLLQGVASRLLASEIPVFWPKILLS